MDARSHSSSDDGENISPKRVKFHKWNTVRFDGGNYLFKLLSDKLKTKALAANILKWDP